MAPTPTMRSPVVRVAAILTHVHGRLHVAESVRHRPQTLGMSDEQMAARRQHVPEPFDQALPDTGVEVDHHVAAEDRVERTAERPVANEVESREAHDGAQLLAYHEAIARCRDVE